MADIPVLGIQEIAFEVKDLDRSVWFYGEVIGLPLYSRGPQQAWFRVGKQCGSRFSRKIVQAAGSISPFSSRRKTQNTRAAPL